MFTARMESDINGSRLIFENPEMKNVGYKSRMLIENHITGFLECNIVYAEGKENYVYDTTSKTSLRNIYEHGEMNHKMLYVLIESIICGMESAGEYLLPVEHLILDPEYIFVENNTGRIFWCYYPGSYNTLKEGMNELAEYILGKADHKEDAAIELAYGFYKQVVNEDYTLRKLLLRHEGLTEPVIADDRDGKKTEKILIEDDRELYPPDEEDAPVIPRSGKVIIMICLSVILLLSGMVLAAAVYKNSSLSKLLTLNEMRIFICMTESMAMLLPILITVKWINSTRRFKQLLMEADKNDDADLYRQVCFGRDG